ncbi:toll/interleukin-1 receptor domain-containing protein [Lentzea sp. NPDC006480]|uniref:toll/interleukin-1 receptor domain-containing protein n=1 Tax=Lentzea sp. NPDC006480 TaxID=3157176 RepID=UPI0033B074B6
MPSERSGSKRSRWSPEEHLKLVDELQARSGSFSESFFDAHGLGTAYRNAGKYSSKRARINAALHASKVRGDLTKVLDAAQTHLLGQPGDPSTESVDQGDSIMASNKLFISHAYADRALATLLHDALRLGGVPADRIFYSSQRGSGIPSGEDVRSYLHRSLTESALVVELLTKTFLTRPMCLMELGGAWALRTPTYPLVVPPLTRDEAVGAIGNVQMSVLDPDGDVDEIFDELQDRVSSDLGLRVRATEWNRAVATFRARFPDVLDDAPAGA